MPRHGRHDRLLPRQTHDPSSIELRGPVSVTGPCETCEIVSTCEGLCHHANLTMLWGMEGFRKVCDTVHNMIEGFREAAPEVYALIGKGTIGEADSHLPKYYDFEIIP